VTVDTSKILERRQQLMGSAYRLFYDEPLHLVRGEGVWLFDSDGKKYLDMYNNVAHVGHCHPRVVDAICGQAGVLNTHTRYLHENVLDYAERLTGKLPNGLDTAMFCCTGSEANELALRIARVATGGTGIVVTDSAYHGNSQATFEISTDSIAAEDLPDHVVTVTPRESWHQACSVSNRHDYFQRRCRGTAERLSEQCGEDYSWRGRPVCCR
jgi:4-aminobutyrate aminotransferase-like enzyme